jgi:recombinational DNA repair protein (RecF pathway)
MRCVFCDADLDPRDIKPEPEANLCRECFEGLTAARAAFNAAIGKLIAKRGTTRACTSAIRALSQRP